MAMVESESELDTGFRTNSGASTHCLVNRPSIGKYEDLKPLKFSSLANV